jgi:S-adenosylmethionine:tRNA ribosyltransferase-isomerase
VKPGKRAHQGHRIEFDEKLSGLVTERMDRGLRLVRFDAPEPIDDIIDRIGHVPLPPYVKRPDTEGDRERYQTVYAAKRGSVAAPTAGLHFTPEVLGLGTFQPLPTEVIADVRLHHEHFFVPASEAAKIRGSKRAVCVGTTSVRTVETAQSLCNLEHACSGTTDLFIYPGYQFQRVGAMLTNFHLPSTSLLLLVAAFAGRELTLEAYRHAVRNKYRFFSYGDCMLIL